MQRVILVLILVLLVFAAFPDGVKEGFLNYLHMKPVDVGTNGPYLQRLPDHRANSLVTQDDLVFNAYNNLPPGQGPQYNYPNLILPSQVVGCGGRRGGCLGGSQLVIPNVPSPKDISSVNIAPVNIATRWDANNPLQRPHQVGVIYKVFGNTNDVYPLYGAKRYFNGDQWDYYTVIQQAGGMASKVPVRTKNHNQRLGDNDPVWLDHCNEEYRTTIYDNGLQYYPYI
jgi:hypothetical protein